MRHCGEDVSEIEVKPDGSWRVKSKSESERRELRDLWHWHNSDGTLCVQPDAEVRAKVEMMKQVKQEGLSDNHQGLKLGIRKNVNGLWEVSKPEDANTSAGDRLPDGYENFEQKVIPMSSSVTGSDDPSVNQDGGGNFDFTNNGIEMDSLSLNVDSMYGVAGQLASAPSGNAEVIVLSDSDDDNDMFTSSGSAYKNQRTDAGEASFSVPPPGIPDSYTEDPSLGAAGGSCLGLFNGNDEEFEMPPWHMSSGNQAVPSFQLFGSDADVSDALVDLHHGSMNGYSLDHESAGIGSAALDPNFSVGRSDADMDDALVDNTLAFGGEDPSLQIFLPTKPTDTSVQPDFRDHAEVSNGVRTEDWISLRLGGGAGGNHNSESATPRGLGSKQQAPTRENGVNSIGDHGLFSLRFE